MSHQHICFLLMPLTKCPYESKRCLNRSVPVQIESICPGPDTHASFHEAKHLSSFFISYFSRHRERRSTLARLSAIVFPTILSRRTLHSRRQEATRLKTGRQLLKLFLSFQQGIHKVPIQRRKIIWWMIHICLLERKTHKHKRSNPLILSHIC